MSALKFTQQDLRRLDHVEWVLSHEPIGAPDDPPRGVPEAVPRKALSTSRRVQRRKQYNEGRAKLAAARSASSIREARKLIAEAESYAKVAQRLGSCGAVAGFNRKGERIKKISIRASGEYRNISGTHLCRRMWCAVCGTIKLSTYRKRWIGEIPEVAGRGRFVHCVVSFQSEPGVPWKTYAKAGHQILKKALSSVLRRSRLGFIRVDHATWSEANGHHPHMHLLLLLRFSADPVEVSKKLKAFFAAEAREMNLRCEWKNRGWWTEIPELKVERVLRYFTLGCPSLPDPGESVVDVSALADFHSEDQPPIDPPDHAPGRAAGAITKMTSTHGLRGVKLWHMPAPQFHEIAVDSYQHHWVSAGGLFRGSEAEDEEDEEDEEKVVEPDAAPDADVVDAAVPDHMDPDDTSDPDVLDDSSDADSDDPEDDEDMDTELTGDELVSIEADAWEELTVEERDLIQGLVHNMAISNDEVRNRLRALLHPPTTPKRRTCFLRRP